MAAKVIEIRKRPSPMGDPRDGMNGVKERMTEGRKDMPQPGMTVTQPGRDSSSERAKVRNKARNAAVTAAAAVREKRVIEDEELRKHVEGALKEAGK